MSTTIEDTIRTLDAARIQSLIEADYAAFEAMCDPRLVYVHSRGHADTFEQYFGNLRSGVARYIGAKHDIDSIIVSDDETAVFVSGRFEAEIERADGRRPIRSLSGITWFLTDGEWKIVAARMTALPD
ncbi:nuclear transport factor 2 family protein [Salinibacterium hongtaonis]|uniref:Nuclear transport factor 2 family protein n=1 Tax=Homoserinimonas hongtaonis TaxID=2079791 RepID=A0A2U1T2H9_9MICO|nr:nuclear transport factor 2 family protein [Salinibacterium hongtaonis]AWB88322.1 hypothetical protein C2138_01065 [Salinibacterium hongtaonis]PWB98076.1 nuclear transport factor 2 family protein [Salinibacterium hongtaonis]